MTDSDPEKINFAQVFGQLPGEELEGVSQALHREQRQRNMLAKKETYDDSFEGAYDLMGTTIGPHIESGLLNEEYALPPISEFEEQFEALKEFYKRMHSRKNWVPKIVFAPMGISLPAWSDMIRTYIEQDDSRWPEPGIDDGERLRGKIELPLGPWKEDGLWDVAVTTAKPVTSDLSADGSQGTKQAKHYVHSALSFVLSGQRLPEDERPALDVLIQRLSPAHPVYYAEQLGSLAAGMGLMHKFAFILGKEDVRAERGDGMARVYHAQHRHYIALGRVEFDRRNEAKDYGLGIKPTITATEAVANQAGL